ncbi:MAG: TIGR02757 family protein [Balneolaceae bacterium]|nr:TIGR02757 family protein [Balneolaceae bacterium]
MLSKPLRKRTPQGLWDLKPYLDEINDRVETADYISEDPVQFLHAFHQKKDREIAGFLAATMAWGRRDIVIAKVEDLLSRMQNDPYRFVMSYNQAEFSRLRSFKHRTFKPIDIHGILLSLKNIYSSYDDFESFWIKCHEQAKAENRPLMALFHHNFFNGCDDLANRTRKHVSNPEKGSTCKRLYMFLRWMIRKDSPVDLGIWDFIPASDLLIPYDVHVARQVKKYGLVSRKSNDWKTVNQLTETLKLLNPDDPARYDYALFGMGALDYSLPKKFILNKV